MRLALLLFLRKRNLATALLAAPLLATAQVSLYQFTQSVGTYTEITAADGGVSLGTPTYWPQQNNNRAWVNNPFNDPGGQVTMSGYLSPAEGPGYPIGFNFTFNGDVFDRIGISNGGWISFGKSSDGLQAVWVYNWSGTPNGDPFIQWYNGPTPSYKRNRVAGFGNSALQQADWSSLVPPGPVGNIRVATIGTAPNRVCVVQWKEYGMKGDASAFFNNINFQIRLNEADNSVEVVFGPQSWVTSLGYKRTQCGLSGQTNADFNGRMTVYEEPAFLYDWNNTVAADTLDAICQFQKPEFGQPNGSGVPPVEGLTWRWDPPVCPPPAWPLVISGVSFDSATASWNATSNGEYEYYLTDTNDVTGPEVASGTTTDTLASFFGLTPATTYFVFIRSICNGEPGVWSLASSFTTIGGGVVECNGGVVEETYCSHQNDTIQWLYVPADASPLRIEFLGGFVGNSSLKVWNASGPVGSPVLTLSGDVTNQAYTALSGPIFMQLITDNGACEAQPWFLPIHWRVGCKNCTDPLVNFNLGTVDCDNGQFYVDANVFSIGSSTTLSMENNAGLPPTVVSSTGVHSIGPFPVGQSVIITAQNPDNMMCYSVSSPIINDPCAIVGCGPDTYTYCYDDNEQAQWAYQGAGGQEIGIRFLAGGMSLGDNLDIYNGLDLMNNPIEQITWGGLANQLFTSDASTSSDHALVMMLTTDNSGSCQTPDPVFGASDPWTYVVACYDGCAQPHATFADSCTSTTSFVVKVNVTDLGSTGSVNITSTSGAPTVTATATGTYIVGPFQATVPVTINVEGASVLCTWTSANRNPDCSTVGITEQLAGGLRTYPNPSNGTFRVELPQGAGINNLQVVDLTGRTVANQAVDSGDSNTLLRLEHLPNGYYTLVAQGTSIRYTTPISIQH